MNEILETLVRRKHERYNRALDAVERLKKLLVENYKVKRIILIGSILDYEKFHVHSDIDLCVEGLRDDQYFQAVGESLIESGEFDIDLIPFENANPRMREKVEKGKVIYEK